MQAGDKSRSGWGPPPYRISRTGTSLHAARAYRAPEVSHAQLLAVLANGVQVDPPVLRVVVLLQVQNGTHSLVVLQPSDVLGALRLRSDDEERLHPGVVHACEHIRTLHFM